LVTQRLQEDVIKRLDILIEAAKQQQQQRSRSRSSSSSSQQHQQQQQQRSQANRAGDGQNRGEVNPPSRQDGALRPPSAALNATWGALPERVREALRQGQSSGFSSIYRSLTEAYYRRLAEEAGR
jgi:transcription initiation factor TFIID subunit TAF12